MKTSQLALGHWVCCTWKSHRRSQPRLGPRDCPGGRSWRIRRVNSQDRVLQGWVEAASPEMTQAKTTSTLPKNEFFPVLTPRAGRVCSRTVVGTVRVPVLPAALPAAPVAAPASLEGKGQQSEHWHAGTHPRQHCKATGPRSPQGLRGTAQKCSPAAQGPDQGHGAEERNVGMDTTSRGSQE